MFCTRFCLTPVIPNHVLITVTFKCATTATAEISATFFASQTVYTASVAPLPNSLIYSRKTASLLQLVLSLLSHGARITIPQHLEKEMLNLINTIPCSPHLLFTIIMCVHLGLDVINIFS